MPNYSIFVLGESMMTISGGAQLDGVTQGDGSHLVGRTITLNSNAWSEIQITDDDANFQDNDTGQRLNGAQVVDGTLFANNAIVEAEYGLTLSDGVNTWTVVGFNVNNSSPSYATVEGLAFIGGPGGFPPVGVPLTVVSNQEGPNFATASYATPICYDAGTLIATELGARPIESLRIGDRVLTLDNGPQPIRWIGGRHVIGAGRFAPMEIPVGVFGAQKPLRISQQHRLLLCDPAAELLFGEPQVFAAATHLQGHAGVRLMSGVRCHYFHLILDRHEVIFANGVASESLHCSADREDDGDSGSFAAMQRFFPELLQFPAHATPLARRSLRRHETRLLLACGNWTVDIPAQLRSA